MNLYFKAYVDSLEFQIYLKPEESYVLPTIHQGPLLVCIKSQLQLFHNLNCNPKNTQFQNFYFIVMKITLKFYPNKYRHLQTFMAKSILQFAKCILNYHFFFSLWWGSKVLATKQQLLAAC